MGDTICNDTIPLTRAVSADARAVRLPYVRAHAHLPSRHYFSMGLMMGVQMGGR